MHTRREASPCGTTKTRRSKAPLPKHGRSRIHAFQRDRAHSAKHSQHARWRKDRTEKTACVFATSVRHRREMWFSAMHCHGANATSSTTCNHSLEWDKRVNRGQRHQRNGLERRFLPAQNRTVESHGYVLHAARDQLYRSEHRAEATINSATPRALKPKISRRATSKNSRARQAAPLVCSGGAGIAPQAPRLPTSVELAAAAVWNHRQAHPRPKHCREMLCNKAATNAPALQRHLGALAADNRVGIEYRDWAISEQLRAISRLARRSLPRTDAARAVGILQLDLYSRHTVCSLVAEGGGAPCERAVGRSPV